MDLTRTVQEKRWQKETQVRQSRLHTGLRGLWNWVSGRAKEVRKQNQLEAYQSLKRDQSERDGLIIKQTEQKQDVQSKINGVRKCQSNERDMLCGNVAFALKVEKKKLIIDKKITQVKNSRRINELSII